MSARFNPPTDSEKACLQVVRTPAKGDLKCVILSRRWVWVPTHWDGRRTVICSDAEDCEICRKQIQAWKGFAIVRPYNGTARNVLSITDNVEPALSSALSGGQDACGLVCRFYRLGNQRNSPLNVQVLGRKEGEVPLDPVSTVRQVERIFRARIDTFLLCSQESANPTWPKVQVRRIP